MKIIKQKKIMKLKKNKKKKEKKQKIKKELHKDVSLKNCYLKEAKRNSPRI